jgi:DNA-binding transcriptional MerR regulator
MEGEKRISHQESFKINEVCSIAGVKPYVLRFWESEFHEISPRIDENEIRYYGHKDIEAITLIKKLLFDEKLTIEKTKLELRLRIVSPPKEENSLKFTVGPEVKKSDILEKYSLNQEAVDNLVSARDKLNKMISLTDSLKQSHNWN